MKRRAFHVLSAFSLLLALAAAVMFAKGVDCGDADGERGAPVGIVGSAGLAAGVALKRAFCRPYTCGLDGWGGTFRGDG